MDIGIIHNKNISYNQNPPYHPEFNYPEYQLDSLAEQNTIYDSVRELFFILGLDKKNYNKKSWNPLGEFINPRYNVLIKPNFVLERNLIPGFGTDCLITHGSIIRAVIDYVYMALNGTGSITIGDAPLQSANFKEIIKISGLNEIIDFYKKNTDFKIKITDFREEKVYRDNLRGFIREKNDGDPLGYSVVDLKELSEFSSPEQDSQKLRVTNYNKNYMLNHHNKIEHSYLISNTVLNSDVIINLPKLKTHAKAGISIALKNIVGINVIKSCLPHHMSGSKDENGDEYLHKDFRKKILTKIIEKQDESNNFLAYNVYRLLYYSIFFSRFLINFKDQFFEGSWYGNKTIPKMICDLNKILFYADKFGSIKDNIQRIEFNLVDGVVGGEEDGPLKPKPKNCGILIAGFNPVAIDIVCSRIMGFDNNKIPTINQMIHQDKFEFFESINDIKIKSKSCNSLDEIYSKINMNFKPSKGWINHIEYLK